MSLSFWLHGLRQRRLSAMTKIERSLGWVGTPKFSQLLIFVILQTSLFEPQTPSTFLLFFTLIWFSNTETLSPFLCTSQSLPVLNLVQSSGVLTPENRSNIRVGKVWEVQWKCESVFCVVLAQLAVRKYWALCWLVDTLLLIWSVVHNVICFWECVSWFQWRSRCRKTTCAYCMCHYANHELGQHTLCYNYDGSEGGSFQPLFFLIQLTENFPMLKSRVKKQRLTCSFSTCWRSFYWSAAFIRGSNMQSSVLQYAKFCVCKSNAGKSSETVWHMCNESAGKIRHESDSTMLQSCSKCKLIKLNEHLGMRKTVGFSRTSTTLGSLFSSCSFLVRLIRCGFYSLRFYSSAAFTHDITVSKGIDMVHRWSIRLGEPIRLELLILLDNVPSLHNVHKNTFPIFKH